MNMNYVLRSLRIIFLHPGKKNLFQVVVRLVLEKPAAVYFWAFPIQFIINDFSSSLPCPRRRLFLLLISEWFLISIVHTHTILKFSVKQKKNHHAQMFLLSWFLYVNCPFTKDVGFTFWFLVIIMKGFIVYVYTFSGHFLIRY